MALSPGGSGGLSFPENNIGRLARRLCFVARNHPLLFGYLMTLLRDRPTGAEQVDSLSTVGMVTRQKLPKSSGGDRPRLTAS